MRIKICIILIILVSGFNLSGQNRWIMEPDGSISWTLKPGETHTDNIEMSGRFISVIYTYGVDEKGNQIKNFVINNGVRADIKLPD